MYQITILIWYSSGSTGARLAIFFLILLGFSPLGAQAQQ